MTKFALIALGVVVSAAALAMAETPKTPAAPAAPATAGAPASPATSTASLLMPTADDVVEGSMMAPVTIVEYASLTCHHCADFTTKTMPQVRKEWIATGKAKYVYRDMPWDNLALGMAKVSRCVPPEQHKAMVEAFFKSQKAIVESKDPMVEIKKISAEAGLGDAQVDACIRDPNIHAKVTASKDTAFNKLGVRGTPTTFVNGTVVNGAVEYGEFKKTLDAEYAKAKK